MHSDVFWITPSDLNKTHHTIPLRTLSWNTSLIEAMPNFHYSNTLGKMTICRLDLTPSCDTFKNTAFKTNSFDSLCSHYPHPISSKYKMAINSIKQKGVNLTMNGWIQVGYLLPGRIWKSRNHQGFLSNLEESSNYQGILQRIREICPQHTFSLYKSCQTVLCFVTDDELSHSLTRIFVSTISVFPSWPTID